MAVVTSSALPWILNGPSDGLISLGLGLLGVLLARTIFVNRENRTLGHRQPLRETLPITLAACLIAGGIIWDGHLLYSKAIFTGIAVGWTTIVFIDKVSRIVNPAETATPLSPASSKPVGVRRDKSITATLQRAFPARASKLPADQIEALRKLDDD